MTHAHWKLGAAASLMLLATACGPAVSGQVPHVPPAGGLPTRTPLVRLPVPLATAPGTAIPAPVVTSLAVSPIPEKPIVLQPESPPAVVGRPYPFTLYTHCGISFALDFAGAFWDYSSGTVDRATLGNPFQAGTMILLAPDQARFDYAGGSIRFRRHQGPKTIAGMCR